MVTWLDPWNGKLYARGFDLNAEQWTESVQTPDASALSGVSLGTAQVNQAPNVQRSDGSVICFYWDKPKKVQGVDKLRLSYVRRTANGQWKKAVSVDDGGPVAYRWPSVALDSSDNTYFFYSDDQGDIGTESFPIDGYKILDSADSLSGFTTLHSVTRLPFHSPVRDDGSDRVVLLRYTRDEGGNGVHFSQRLVNGVPEAVETAISEFPAVVPVYGPAEPERRLGPNGFSDPSYTLWRVSSGILPRLGLDRSSDAGLTWGVDMETDKMTPEITANVIDRGLGPVLAIVRVAHRRNPDDSQTPYLVYQEMAIP